MPRWTSGEARITSRMVINPETGCWDWNGIRTGDGYGRLNGVYAHRIAYEVFVAPIPDKHEVDHLCNRRCCVNPAHLEPVTRNENMRRVAERRTHCKSGHEFTPENTYHRTPSGRGCRKCNSEAVRRYIARRAAA